MSRLIAILLGAFAGILIYSNSSIDWIYQLDGRYLTFTQPRFFQSISNLKKAIRDNDKEHIIILGGSGAYHSISEKLISEKLQKMGRDVEVNLVSFASQTLLDSLVIIDNLPVNQGSKKHIVLSWSFWRFLSPPLESLEKFLKNDRHILISDLPAKLLKEGKYDPFFSLSSEDQYSDWKDYVSKKSLDFDRRHIFSKWSKYFILDKLQKMSRKTPSHRFFKDSYVFLKNSSFSDKRIDAFRKYYTRALHQKKHEFHLGKFIKASTQYADKNYSAILDFYLEIVRMSFERARSKGYKFTLLQLPISPEVEKIPRVNLFRETLMSRLSQYISDIPSISAEDSAPPMDQFFDWYDFVHTTKIGAKEYSNKLPAVFSKFLLGEKGE